MTTNKTKTQQKGPQSARPARSKGQQQARFSLLTSQSLQRLQDDVQQVVLQHDMVEAKDFADSIVELARLEKVSSAAPELYVQYQQLVTQLRWVSLPLLPWPEVLDQFRQSLAAGLALHAELDIVEKLRDRLEYEDDVDERDEYRERIRQAIQSNTEKLTAEQLSFNDRQTTSTIANWVKLYVATLGIEPVDQLAYQDFLIQDPNLSKLSPEQRQQVTALFDLFEELKYKSSDMLGNEDREYAQAADGTVVEYRQGTFTPLTDEEVATAVEQVLAAEPANTVAPTKTTTQSAPASSTQPQPVTTRPTVAPQPTVSTEAIRQRYRGDEGERQRIIERMEQMRSTVGGNIEQLYQQLHRLVEVQTPDKEEVVAALLLLAEVERLDDILKEDPQFGAVVIEQLQRRQDAQGAKDFALMPTAPRFLQLFLSTILQDRLGLPEGEAARIGLWLGNTLKRSGNDRYSQLAYFDVAKNDFAWRR